MPKRRIVVLSHDEAWNRYLVEAFEDTPSHPEILKSAQEAAPILRKGSVDVVFANADLLSPPCVVALQMHRSSSSSFRAFSLGWGSHSITSFAFDERFGEAPPPLSEFQKKVATHLPLPDPLRVLVVDDEPEIGGAFKEYFEGRRNPTFVIETARDGAEGERKIEASPPHVLVLDIKMPVQDGRELYRELKKKDKLPPTIVFFDAISADEVLEIRRWGNPAFVEKGAHSSAMPELAALVKKIAYFG